MTDAYSEWDIDYGFGVGRAGTATMTIQGGAFAYMGQCMLGEVDSGDGTLIVEDYAVCNLTDADNDSLTIGQAGQGTVAVRFDGELTSEGRLRVAELGGSYGQLWVEMGGLVAVGGQMAVGCGVDAVGDVTVADSGRLDVHNHLLIGGDAGIGDGGTGTFIVREDGYASADHVRVGDAVGGGVWLSGTLSGSGTINGHLENDGGLVSPGTSTGVMFVGGDYTQHSGGALHIQIGGPIPGDDFDQLAVAGMASLGGLLDVSFIDDFTPEVGDQFDIMTFGDCFRDFEMVQLPDNSGGVFYCVTMVANAVTFLATVPADFDCDGVADLDDFAILKACMSGPANAYPTECDRTDLNRDSRVDLADFGEFQGSFGGA